MDWGDVGIRISYQIKRRGWPERRRKLSPFSPITEIMFSSFVFLSFFYRHVRLSYYSWLKDTKTFGFQKI
jgi:hypothetical protein